MKHVKKLLSAVLVLVLALTMVLPVAAEGETTYSITIENDKTGHVYEAYQIFAGDLYIDDDGAAILSNIVWGNGVSDTGKTALGEEKTYVEGLKNAEDAKAFTKTVEQYLSTPSKTVSTVTEGQGYVLDGLSAGYYLVKDTTVGSSLGDGDAYSSYILEVVKDVTATPKSGAPSVDKKVQDETADAEQGSTDGWGESADHAINESFQFKLTASLPIDDDFADYEEYKVVFNDTMSEGVTFESIASVKVNNTDVLPANYQCTAKNGDAGTTWSLTIGDIITATGATIDITKGVNIEVIYNAHLNEKAQVHKEDATEATTNNNKVELQYSNNPNAEGLGTTPEDYVWVFTYEVDNKKVIGGTDTPLAGAGFRLYDSTGETEISLIFDDTLNAYRPIKEDEGAEEMKSAETTGIFNIVGLDAGTYVLKETTVPDGYNKCVDTTIVISAAHKENASEASADLTLEENSSNIDNTIENNKGTTLPGTGGIGTTIFYVVGGILVVGAAVLLIAKKRTRM